MKKGQGGWALPLSKIGRPSDGLREAGRFHLNKSQANHGRSQGSRLFFRSPASPASDIPFSLPRKFAARPVYVDVSSNMFFRRLVNNMWFANIHSLRFGHNFSCLNLIRIFFSFSRLSNKTLQSCHRFPDCLTFLQLICGPPLAKKRPLSFS